MHQLPRDTPASQGVDPAAVLGFLDAVDADPAVELHGLMVLRHGHVVAEGWWAPHTPERTRLLYSISKSFTSTALALAVDEGLLGLDDTVLDHFPEYADEDLSAYTRSTTLRHLASMASGHGREMWPEAVAADPSEPVRGFLVSAAPEHAPGSVFAYSQPCTYTVAAAIQRRTGQRLSEYLRARLFDPLGIGEVGWRCFPPGREQGFSGLFARLEDVAKLGQLYLQRGRWGDDQLIPVAYVDEATSAQVPSPDMDQPDWSQGYGYCFWIARHGYRGDGAFGQFCIVLPEHDAVIAITGGTEAMQEVVDHVWSQLLPGLGGSVDASAQDALDDRLRTLGLPPCAADPSPVVRADEAGPGLAAGTFTVSRGDDRIEVTATEGDNILTFPVGLGSWLTSEPVDAYGDPVPLAASGGWIDGDTLRVEVVFLETPHRIDVECSLSSGASHATWRTAPLDGGRIKTLHRPR
ncbi:class A beta-lactamase-related serine hydrolase [Nocardioides glacieisoli]|uniref:Class A beta-lactamase-related serine hydrolase n=1 Tax=Nocardioides glacieisoli TaxID=1168730 RepID=A0A4Q2RX54_9ACTN|nr:serine hydrolase domain-containing protein [Nocardioides glacieisoli]RYB92479.1 class A beta-lactamase-related serine hydrolase [Nocardioides glacieisoli]